MQLMEQRQQLACALRWAARLDLHEGVDNHFSLAVPDDDGEMRGNRFLINPYGYHWSEINASSLVLCDEEGNAVVSWQVINAFPTKLDAPTFDANSNDVAIESMELLADDVLIDES